MNKSTSQTFNKKQLKNVVTTQNCAQSPLTAVFTDVFNLLSQKRQDYEEIRF